MRFLKTKIQLAQEALQRQQQNALSDSQSLSSPILSPPRAKRACSMYSENILASTFTKPTKNMIINYGKAIFSFAMSDLANEYIERYFRQESIHLPSFHEYLLQLKPMISGYKNFEGFFIIKETDNSQVVLYKKVLKKLGEIFMKYFSVNWIFHGKVAHKLVYLRHRHAILQRIMKPQNSA